MALGRFNRPAHSIGIQSGIKACLGETVQIDITIFFVIVVTCNLLAFLLKNKVKIAYLQACVMAIFIIVESIHSYIFQETRFLIVLLSFMSNTISVSVSNSGFNV